MKKEMLINVLQPEESRIAIVEDGLLEELYVERSSHESYVGNIYKGRIVNIEPSIQAAFVDFGVGRNGFLHVSDVEPAYYRHMEGFQNENGNRRRKGGKGRKRRDDRDDDDDETDKRAVSKSVELADEFEGHEPDEQLEFEDEIVIEDENDDLDDDENEDTEEKSDVAGADDDDEKDELAATAVETEKIEAKSETGDDEQSSVADAPSSEKDGEEPKDEDDEPVVKLAQSNGAPSDESEDEKDESSAMGELTTADSDEPTHEKSDEDTGKADKFVGAMSVHSESAAAESVKTPESTMVMTSTERRTEVVDETDEEDDADLSDEELSFSMGQDEDEDEDEFSDETEEVATGAAVEEPEADETRDERDDQKKYDRRGRRNDSRRNPSRSDGPRRRGRGGPRGGPRRQSFGRPKPLIQDIFKKGQEVLVQVIKEGIGTKGPTLSTYISIAGRYLVLMPGLNRIGVSRKIDDEEQRRRLREVMHDLQPPKGLGFIIRTAGIDRTKKDLQRDLGYLSRLWEVVVRRIRKLKAPAEIYQESDMITRTIRDTFSSEINTIWVDQEKAYEHAQEFLQIVMPRYANRIKRYDHSVPMFHKYGIENEISRIQQRTVPLQHGGSIVIDQTEALVAIDVNSGNFRADNNAEETAYQMNLLAAREIARQLRLRDMGGVIVIDFIDMREEKHRRSIERALREAVKRDRARTKILKISAFGIVEMTRQRIRPSLKRSIYQDCPHCLGAGQVKSCESMSIDVMRLLQLAGQKSHIQRVDVHVQEDVAHYLQNRKRTEIASLENDNDVQVIVSGEPNVPPETLEFFCYDNNNNEVKFLSADEPRPVKQHRD